jgi:regulator of nucleoside diphosphate kinase
MPNPAGWTGGKHDGETHLDHRSGGGRERNDLAGLKQEFARAKIVSAQSVHTEVVTMNSKVLLHDLDTDEEMDVVLVFPEKANPETGCISVLAPVGTGILGYRRGDMIEWPVPAGLRRLHIKEIL